MAKYTGKFWKVEEYEVEANSLDEAMDKLEDLVTFDYDKSEFFDEDGVCVDSSY